MPSVICRLRASLSRRRPLGGVLGGGSPAVEAASEVVLDVRQFGSVGEVDHLGGVDAEVEQLDEAGPEVKDQLVPLGPDAALEVVIQPEDLAPDRTVASPVEVDE